ncbi:MAG: hypothetical protein KUG79_15935 [Pseudomonadales bacterium]|nr:hypothetical protein [Pseudomonadales bacterium]
MGFSVFDANTYQSNAFNRHTAPPIGINIPASAQVMPPSAAEGEDSPRTFSDKVSISDAARNISRNHTSTEYYLQFMPTYEGFSAANLAAGVLDPSLETFSLGKDFNQVTTDARASLDKNYEKLEAIGKPYVIGSTPPIVANSLYGELDRRALYAVSSNEGGLFTDHEQKIARNRMSQQQGLAMGLYSGPTSEKSKFVDPFRSEHDQQFKAGIIFLDGVSNEENAGSIEFAFQRAGLQEAYERLSVEKGNTPEDVNIDHPLVNLILAARSSVNSDYQLGPTEGPIRSADDLKRQSWFRGFEGLLENAIQKTENLYLSSTPV